MVRFQMHKPSHLPFHMLAWGQYFVQYINCRKFRQNSTGVVDNSKGFPVYHYDTKDIHDGDEYQICNPSSFPLARGGPINVTAISHLNGHRLVREENWKPLKYIYYTECDQIVKYDNDQTFLALSAASNDSTFFTGRRKEKNADSNPEDYMGGLTIWRECGIPGYSLTWPKSNYIYHDV